MELISVTKKMGFLGRVYFSCDDNLVSDQI